MDEAVTIIPMDKDMVAIINEILAQNRLILEANTLMLAQLAKPAVFIEHNRAK